MNEYSFLPTISDNHELRKKYSKLTAQLLLNRGIENLDDVEKFLNPQWNDNYDPFLLHNMEKSITRCYEAIKNNEKITIYVDYDADGIPGSIVLASLFEKINYTNFNIYIPHRHDEGYGIHIPALEKIKEHGTKLIITIDVGITAHDAAAWSVKNNIDMIITDHHLPLKNSDETQNLPKSFALINPKQTLCDYPDPMLCGCGVIFKFVQAFVQKHGEEYNIDENWEKWLLDMVGISTISDMVPLQNENRIFASLGLKVIQEIAKPRNNHRIGLKKLLWDAGINAEYMTEEDIAFGITPRINAASRMSHPQDAVAVFMADDEQTAGSSVTQLTKLNNERKKLTKKMTNEAISMLSEKKIVDIVLVGHSKWQAGILGLVASNLVEKYKVPAFVWSQEGEVIKGSCRSLDGIHLVDVMSGAAKKTFLGFGGHAMAGGFSCSINEIEKLEKRLQKSIEKFKTKNNDIEKDIIAVDMELSPDAISVHNYQEMRKPAPFGIGNTKPLFIFKNVLIDKAGTFGRDKNHLELFFKNSLGKTIRGIAFFKTPSDFEKLHTGKSCDILAHMVYSVFMGKHELRLQIVDIL